ncbi:MAG: hypothetical protein U0270_11840 [Labilithrix sp.]
MLARLFEVANVCFSIMVQPARTTRLRPANTRLEPVDDYSSALMSFQRAFPRL